LSSTPALENLSAVGRSQDEHQQPFIVDLVDDAVVASPHSPFACATNQPSRRRRAWVLGKEFDDRLETSSGVRIELAELAACSR